MNHIRNVRIHCRPPTHLPLRDIRLPRSSLGRNTEIKSQLLESSLFLDSHLGHSRHSFYETHLTFLVSAELKTIYRRIELITSNISTLMYDANLIFRLTNMTNAKTAEIT